MKTINVAWVLVIALSAMPAGWAAASSSWPNEPDTAKSIVDFSFNAMEGNGLIFAGGNAAVITDSTSPLSPSNVIQYTYSQGFVDGVAAAKHYYPYLKGLKEVYFGYWWKPSNPWDGHPSGTNKISFVMNNGNNFIISMHGQPGGPYNLIPYLEFPGISNGHLSNSWGDNPGTRVITANVGSFPVQLGKWHRVEVYLKHGTSTTSRNGIVRWWVNGVMVGNYNTVNFPNDGWLEWQFSPTWGGMGQYKKKQTDYFWFDHVHISSPNGGGSTVRDEPAGAPAAPRLLNVTVQ